MKISFYKRCAADYRFNSLFNNTLFFLNEIDFYDYSENVIIPNVSKMLNLGSKLITDKFLLPNEIEQLFLEKVIVRTKFTKISYKNSKTSGVEVTLEKPTFKDADQYPECFLRLFGFVIDSISLDNENNKVSNYIKKHGIQDDDDWFYLPIGDVIPMLKLTNLSIKDYLMVGVESLFRKKYNDAVTKLKTREKSLNEGGYFVF